MIKSVVTASIASALLVVSLAAQQTPPAPAAPTLKAGDKAPAFSLMGTDGKTHTLADMKGKFVVLAWFPKAMTTGCTQECHSISDNIELLKNYDVNYFMISVDKPEDNLKFVQLEKANFVMLSDPDKTVANTYGVLGRSGLANRWTFYIAPDGTLAKVDPDSAKHTVTAGPDLIANFDALKIPKKK